MRYVFMAAIFTVSDQKQIQIYGLPVVDLLAIVTFLVVLFTLRASLRAAQETARANILGHLPLITLSYEMSKDSWEDKVTIENSGNGIATNVKVDNFYNWWADKDFNLYGLTTVVFSKIPILKDGDKQTLQVTTKGVTDTFGIIKYIMFSKTQKKLVFAITFSDLSGQRYITKVAITSGVVEIILSPRRFTLIQRFNLLVMRLGELAIALRNAAKVQIAKYKHQREKKAGASREET